MRPARCAVLAIALLTVGCGDTSADPNLPTDTADTPDALDAQLDGTDTLVGPDAGVDTDDVSPSSDITADSSDIQPGDTDPPDLSNIDVVINGPSRTDVNTELRLTIEPADAVASVRWNAGTQNVTTSEDGNDLLVQWSARGRYSIVAQVLLTDGNRASVATNVTVLPTDRFEPVASSSIAEHSTSGQIAVLNSDAGAVSIFNREGAELQLDARVEVCPTPRTLTWVGNSVWATCQSTDELAEITSDGVQRIALEYGDRPFGVIEADGRLWVTAQGPGELLEIDPESAAVIARTAVGPDARGLATMPDGRIIISRWRALPTHSELYLVDTEDGAVDVWEIERDNQAASDTETPGVLGYLSAPIVSPWGDRIAITGTQANIVDGLFLDAEALVFDTTLRAAVVFLDAVTGDEAEARKLFDGRGLCAGGAWTPDGDYLGVVTRDARSVERLDRLAANSASGTLLDVGLAPEFMQWTRDGELLLVDASLSRELVVFEQSAFINNDGPIQRLPTVDSEPLSEEVLRGKVLFNDAFDPRLTRDSYISCAGCHLDGEADHLTWDFTDRGEGLRNTISLVGRAAAHGPIHWSGNFDEVQDFEHDIRGPFGGTGLMDDADFNTGTRNTTLGDAKAGVSADLDALAAYVQSLTDYPRSPYRQADGSLTEDALAGEILFASDELGCSGCHSGATFTDSQFLPSGQPLLHDVGTLTSGSGGRLGGELPGLDTPTLLELFNSAPFLHDGSAATLAGLLGSDGERVHDLGDDLSESELDQLVTYLLSLDATSASLAP